MAYFLKRYRLVGPVGKASASRAEDQGFDSRLRRGDFSGSSHTNDLKIGTLVATLPGAWRSWVSAGTGWSGVIILWLGKIVSSICNFSVWQHVNLSKQISPWDTLARCWDVKQAINKQFLHDTISDTSFVRVSCLLSSIALTFYLFPLTEIDHVCAFRLLEEEISLSTYSLT